MCECIADTAEEARAYKPRFQTFEYMFDRLGCPPDQMMHVSSSFRYDLMTASTRLQAGHTSIGA
jgi:FMN phosphatase YigB (HAD superfamily)